MGPDSLLPAADASNLHRDAGGPASLKGRGVLTPRQYPQWSGKRWEAGPIVGRLRERRRLATALKQQRPLLVLGAHGSGKTRLLLEAARSVCAAEKPLYIPYPRVLHDLLVAICFALQALGEFPFEKMMETSGAPQRWAASQTSVRLKGLLWTAFEERPRILILDGVDRASYPVYRFLQRLAQTKGMTLVAAAADARRLGPLQRIFWNRAATVEIPPLSRRAAARLFELATDRFGLLCLDVEEFRPRVLQAARGNPGQIIEMCRLAADPRYRSGDRVKFAPLRIDAMSRFLA